MIVCGGVICDVGSGNYDGLAGCCGWVMVRFWLFYVLCFAGLGLVGCFVVDALLIVANDLWICLFALDWVWW